MTDFRPIICSFVPTVGEISPVSATPRHKDWDRESRAWALSHPCAVTGSTEGIEVHHIRPFHLFPELEMDPANWISLIRPWHLYLGHVGNWSNWNPNVREDAERFRRMIEAFRKGST